MQRATYSFWTMPLANSLYNVLASEVLNGMIMTPEVSRSKRLTAVATGYCDYPMGLLTEQMVRTVDVLESEVVLEGLHEAGAEVSPSGMNGLDTFSKSIERLESARLSPTIEPGLSTTMKPRTWS